jgi:hypothetical protein
MGDSFGLRALAGVCGPLGFDPFAVAGCDGRQGVTLRFDHRQLAACGVKLGRQRGNLPAQSGVGPAG